MWQDKQCCCDDDDGDAVEEDGGVDNGLNDAWTSFYRLAYPVIRADTSCTCNKGYSTGLMNVSATANESPLLLQVH